MSGWFPNPGATEGNDSFTGTAGADTAEGFGGDDTLQGEGGNDRLLGGTGADLLTGGEGNDVLGASGIGLVTSAGPVADTLLGGAGDDSLYSTDHSNSLVTRGDSLVGGEGNDTAFIVLGQAAPLIGLTLSFVPDAAGVFTLTGAAADLSPFVVSEVEQIFFIGSSEANRIEGRLDVGNDTINGTGGDDTLRGWAGADSLVGEADRDLLEGGEGRDTLDGGSEADTLSGDAGNDVLRGGAGTDSLLGGADNDLLVDLAGNDALDGGDGNDSLLGGADNDTLLGGAGNDSLNSEAGDDLILGGEGRDTAFGGDGADTILGEGGSDSLRGGTGNDSLDGGAGDDSIEDGDNSLSGADTVVGGDGNDWLVSRSGGDSVVGGDGYDRLIFRHTQQFFNDPVSGPPLDFRPVDSATPTPLGEGSTVVGVEVFDIIGSNLNDTIQGLDGEDSLNGNGGADLLLAGAGDNLLVDANYRFNNDADTMIAGGGNDRIITTGGADSIDGGSGEDTLTLGGVTGVSDANIPTDFRPVDSETPASLGVIGGSVVGVEVFNFTGGAGDDTFFGLDGNDSLDGGTGADLIAGRGGNDTLEGGNPSIDGAPDTMLGGDGDDLLLQGSGFEGRGAAYIDGGEDFDTLQMTRPATLSIAPMDFNPVSSTIEASTGDGVTVINVERFVIAGSERNDTIGGLENDDSLSGERGDDLLRGQGGNDTLSGHGGSPTNLRGNDTLEGGSGDDLLVSQDNIPDGTGGADRLDGGEGDDLAIIFRNQVTAADKVLNFTPQDTQEAALGDGGVVLGVERFQIRGTTLGDTISGLVEGGGGDTIEGEGGNDSLLGQVGDDSLRDGDFRAPGDDTMLGGVGSDTIESWGGHDSLIGGDSLAGPDGDDDTGIDLAVLYRFQGSDTLDFRPVDADSQTELGDGTTLAGFERFFIIAGAARDTLAGLDDADTFAGGGGDDSLQGQGGADSLAGDAAIDTLEGGDGADTLDGGQGGDWLHGGADGDIADYRYSSAGVTVSLTPGAAQSGGDAAGDTLTDIEGLAGSDHNDWLSGLDDAPDTLLGGGGDDTIVATGGADVLDGGSRVTFGFGSGFATVPGHDLLDAGADTAGVVIDLAAQTVAGGLLEGDSIARFEDAAGGTGDDSILGDGGANTLLGRGGDDTITGGAGNDRIDAGSDGDLAFWRAGDGDDTIQFGAGSDTLHLAGWTGDETDDWTETTETDGARLFSFGAGGSVRAYGLETVTCFLAGTMIATPTGEVPIETLRAGDMVLTGSDGGIPQGVVWMGRTRVAVAGRADPIGVAPVLIRAGALGGGLPRRDLRVSPEHGMLLDGHLVPALLLVNGRSIVQEAWRAEAAYWHIELPAHGLVLAEGAASETYFDDGNRDLFDNHAVTSLFKDFRPCAPSPRYEAAACRPVLRGGAALARLRARLEGVAAAMRGRAAS
ncbi:Hint domain-containing protein [Roseomonas fluvialis]|uniref:Hedgehog/Intein (Hint) domain-containing protein n=1 Tax=Roseomonas fluvialis TaxID=1750527 RepID=A0ABM7Y616_9PROT|nr:Hint domain-containing protein [Roseomonas fluvialis]BDG73374.1 hypothetical protein Rmf_33030 [Roseomonas fluvialis]